MLVIPEPPEDELHGRSTFFHRGRHARHAGGPSIADAKRPQNARF
jgi:hypothetical protein